MQARVAVISASLGGFDGQQVHEKQSVKCDYYHFDDANVTPRINSMTPRLQARIVKMFSWQLAPYHEYYLWVDSSCRLSSDRSVEWFLGELELSKADIAVFKHPHRKTVQEEADYLKHRLAIKCPYITPRYGGEDIDGQLEAVDPTRELYASTAFIYRNTPEVQLALKEWWYHTSRFHSIDQLSFPEVISHLRKVVIEENYLKIPWLEYVRNK